MRLHFTIDRRDRLLGAAVGLSLALHAAALSVQFKFPDARRWKPEHTPIEVVLVNARTKERPAKSDVLAQSNLNRGGTVEQNRRAKTPLPVTEPRDPGKDLADAQRRQRSLEAQQQELLARMRESPSRVPAAACSASESPTAAPRRRSRLSMVKCNLTSVLQAFHILGFLTSALCCIVHARGAPAKVLAVRGSERAL